MEIDPTLAGSEPARHPEEFQDTEPHALEVWLELLRSKTPGERIAATLGLTSFALQMSEMGVRRMHPEASDREVFLRVAARHLPRDLMIRAYKWDPEVDGVPR
ncbi:MAG TPA: hypothetical protein VN841_02310 [Bryobacteraceae bacterium]|nr:hypothetical protein [Bryobacteraceae bacterium]